MRHTIPLESECKGILLKRIISLLNRFIKPASTILHGLGTTVLALMMFLTAGDVGLRYFFNRPIIGAYDLTEYMMAITISFGLAYCALFKGHVRVELLTERFPKRVQAVIDLITSLLSLGLFSFITWQCFVNVKLQFESGFTSTVLLIPIYPFVGLVGLGCAVLTLVLLVEFLETISMVIEK